MQPKNNYWVLLFLLLCTIIFYLTSSSLGTFSETLEIFHKYNWWARKAAHASLFGLLAITLQRILKESRFSYLIAWIFVTAYGLSDEWHQMFVANRTPLLSDVAIDSTGAFLALTILFLLFQFKNKRKIDFDKYPMPNNPDSPSSSLRITITSANSVPSKRGEQ